MNKSTIAHYSKLVEYLGHALGPNYEVILHDVSQKCIVAIANGHVSGRSVGAPLTDWALKIMAERTYETRDYICNYSGKAKFGKVLRSSTLFIKDTNGSLIGMLCINLDTTKFQELSNDILQLSGLDTFTSLLKPTVADSGDHIETFSESVADVTATVLTNIFGGPEVMPEKLTQDEKLNVVSVLNQKGVFFLKGAVSEVASQLQCSEASIYRYLSKINKAKSKSIKV